MATAEDVRKHASADVQAVLRPDESIIREAGCLVGVKPGWACLTNQRLRLYHAGSPIRFSKDVQIIEVSLLNVLEAHYHEQGFGGRLNELYVQTSQGDLRWKYPPGASATKEGPLWPAAIMDARNNALGVNVAANVAAEPANATPDLADQLVKLVGLRDQGILTDEEFQAQKSKLLSQ
jgi:hypothetical protein